MKLAQCFTTVVLSLVANLTLANLLPGKTIYIKYIASDYQRISVSSSFGDLYLDRKLVKDQGFSVPYKNPKGKKIKLFTIVTEHERLTLKPSCSKKESNVDLANDLFELSGSAKKPPCLMTREPLDQTEKTPSTLPKETEAEAAKPTT